MSDDKQNKFAPIEFVPVFGSTFDTKRFSQTALVLPTMSAGMNSYIGVELFINNENVTKVGYLLSEYISPMVLND
jgi:hypothetical protein